MVRGCVYGERDESSLVERSDDGPRGLDAVNSSHVGGDVRDSSEAIAPCVCSKVELEMVRGREGALDYTHARDVASCQAHPE